MDSDSVPTAPPEGEGGAREGARPRPLSSSHGDTAASKVGVVSVFTQLLTPSTY